jgi:hypothetical protein
MAKTQHIPLGEYEVMEHQYVLEQMVKDKSFPTDTTKTYEWFEKKKSEFREVKMKEGYSVWLR